MFDRPPRQELLADWSCLPGSEQSWSVATVECSPHDVGLRRPQAQKRKRTDKVVIDCSTTHRDLASRQALCGSYSLRYRLCSRWLFSTGVTHYFKLLNNFDHELFPTSTTTRLAASTAINGTCFRVKFPTIDSASPEVTQYAHFANYWSDEKKFGDFRTSIAYAHGIRFL